MKTDLSLPARAAILLQPSEPPMARGVWGVPLSTLFPTPDAPDDNVVIIET